MSNKTNFKAKMESLGHNVAKNLHDFIDNDTNKTSSFYQTLINLFDGTIKSKFANCKYDFYKSYPDANQSTFNLYVKGTKECLDSLGKNLTSGILSGYNSAGEFYLQMKGQVKTESSTPEQDDRDAKLAALYGDIVPSGLSDNKLTRADFNMESVMDDIKRIKNLING